MHNGTEAATQPRPAQSENEPGGSQYSLDRISEVCREHPMTSLMVGLGVGLGTGLLIGTVLGGSSRSSSSHAYFDKINRRVSEALADVVPQSWR